MIRKADTDYDNKRREQHYSATFEIQQISRWLKSSASLHQHFDNAKNLAVRSREEMQYENPQKSFRTARLTAFTEQ